MFQPKPSMRYLGTGLAILLLLSLAVAASWNILPRLGIFGPAPAAAVSSDLSNLPEPMSPTVVATVGAGGTYSTLKAAFDDINSGSGGLTGTVELDVVGDTNETAAAVLNASGTGGASYTSVLIKPTGGAARIISGSVTAGSPLIDLNGADNVTIDGLNSGGNSLTVSNTTASAAAGTSTIRFVGGATDNKLKNLTILGSFSGGPAVDGGTIAFGTDTVTGNGNDRNLVANNNIGPAGSNLPSKAVSSVGSTTTPAENNSNNAFADNNIYDFFGTGVGSAGIYLSAGTTDSIITNNRFYQTDLRTQTTASQHSAIWIDDPAGNNFKIVGNTIGFASSTATGSYAVVQSLSGTTFVPVYLNVGTTVATSIQSNTIAGISVSGAGSGSGTSAPFCGILVNGGLTTIGDASANIIGSSTANDSIVFATSSAASSDVVAMANFGSSDWVTNNNSIGGITASNSSTGAASIDGIRAAMPATANWTARNNIVGGTIADSISSTSTASASKVRGLVTTSAASAIRYNIVRSLTAAGGTGTGPSASVAGIVVDAASADHTLTANTVTDLSNSAATAATAVTGIQFNAASGANVVERNLIERLLSSTNSNGAEINGIRVDGGTATYRNNMILLGAGVSNAIGTAAAPGMNGIKEVLGTDTFLHNSVYLAGSPSTGAGASFAFNSSVTGSTRVFRNNIFFNARSNTGTATGKNYAVRVGGTGVNPAGLTINNNVYLANGTGGVFGSFNGADVVDLAAWKTAVGQDVNSLGVDPLFTSATDLHLASASPARDAAATGLGVSNDFDNKARPGGNASFDIGADEFDGTAAVVNDIQANAFVEPLDGSVILAGAAFTPQATFTNGGSASQSNVTIRYRICADVNCTTSVYDQTATIASIASQASGTFSFPAATVPTAGTFTIRAKAELATDTVPANDEIVGSLVVEGPLAGGYSVGAGGNYTSIGQAISKLSSLGVDGPVTLSLTDASYGAGETFPITIGPIPGASSTNRITIKPAATASPVISGSSASCIVTLAGADYVTIDGSNNGTSTRDLSVVNTNAGTNSAVLCLQTASGPDGATNDTFKNINVSGNGNTQTLFGIFSGDTGLPSLVSLGNGNSANTFENNKISKTQYGIYSKGASTAAKNTGNTFSLNQINTPSPNNVGKGGILLGFENNVQVTGNSVDGIAQSGGVDVFGIALGLTSISTTSFAGSDVTNATVSGNFIGSVRNTGNLSAAGIAVASAASGTNVIANNVIYGVAANGTGSDLSASIIAGGGTGSTTKIYFNSVSMTGTLTGSTGPNYGLAIGGSDPSVDARNNVFYNTLATGSGVSFAIGTASSTFANLTSEYNDLFVTPGGGTFKTGKTGSLSQGSGTEHTLLSDWAAATGRDSLHSIGADPQFKSATDLRPQTVSAIIGAGVPIAGFGTDIIGSARNGTTPTIGAYEAGIDTIGPAISYSPLANTASVANRTLTISVTDLGGVPTSGTGLPHIYYRKGSSGAFTATTQCSFTSGSNYDCTIDYSQIAGGAATGDSIQYYVAAEDNLANVAVNPSAGAGGFTADPPAATTPPTSPASYTIVPGVSGAISVGTSQTYTSLTNNSPTGLFKALNSAIITGDVTVNITSDLTIEDGAVALNQLVEEGVGGYRITFKPSGAPRTISGSSSGALITLNGADRVTFDGTSTSFAPDAAGDNLTISNSNAGTSSAVVWVRTGTGSNGATQNIFKNLVIAGNSASTTLFGIGFGGTSIGLNSLGTGNNGNRVEGCDIQRAQYGIYSQGASLAAKNTGNVFTQNTLAAVSPNNLGKGGIILGFENGPQVTENAVSNITQAGAVDVFGISLGIQSLTTTAFSGNEVTGAVVSRNLIGSIRNTGTFSACGICIAPAASGLTQIANNVVSGVAASGTAGHISTGIFSGGGSGSTTPIVYNSVSMTGSLSGGSEKSFALAIGSGDPTVEVRNNILYNTQTNGSGSNYAIAAGSATFANLTSNYNDLFVSTDASHFIGATGSLSSPVDRVTLANWTSATGKDTPNSISADPQFISASDLHPQTVSSVIGAATPIAGITTDVTGAPRSATVPTIGAYEAGVDTIGPAITYTALAKTTATTNRTLSITVTDHSGVPTSGAGLPRIYFRKGTSGPFTANTQCAFVSGSSYNCTIDYSLLPGGSVATGDTIQYYVVAQDNAGNGTANPAAGAGGFSINPPAASTPPTTPNSYLIAASVSGTFDVGTAQTFTSLTKNDAGGIFRYINTNIVTGNVTINLTSDLASEDGAVALNEITSPFTLTIVPTGGPRVISGTSTGPTALIKLSGADRITINGSVDGSGTDRSLSISNSNANGAVIWIASADPSNGAGNNTIEYCNISGSGSSGTIAGLLSGSGASFGDPAEAANDNNTFRGNVVTRAQNGVYINGKATGGDANWLITGNTLGSTTAADKLGLRGVFAANTSQVKVQQNTIAGVVSTAVSPAVVSGVTISGVASGGEISANQISDIKQMNPAGIGSNGVLLASTSANGNLLVSNNFISDVASQGSAGVTANDNGYGLVIASGGGYRIYNNTISMNTDQASASSVTAAMYVAAGVTGVGSLDVRNNAFSNTETVGTRYGIYVASTAGNTIFSAIDYNDYFAQNIGFLGAPRATISAWRTATGKDVSSISADPKFVSLTDLHILEGSPLFDAGVTIAAVPFDIDGDPRPTFTSFDIGADEYVDRIPPDTTIDSKPSDPSNSSTANFAFSGTDTGGSGIAGFECKLDGGSFAACPSPINYPNLAEGSHTFSVKAKDNAGNFDLSPASYTWTVDTIAPDTQIVSTPADFSNSSSATFGFTGADTIVTNAVTFECSLDAAQFAPCSSTKTYAGLADGDHTFQVRAVDPAHNFDTSPASFTWNVDTQPPDTLILTKPTDPSTVTDATFTFSGTDTIGTNTVTFECQLDTGSYAPCNTPKTYTGLSEGSHTFTVRARDRAGNYDPTPATFTWFIDSIKPDTQITGKPSDPSNSSDADFAFTGTDLPPNGTITFECKLDTSAFAACTSPISYHDLPEGSHTFQVRAIDAVGNVDASPASYTWTIIYPVSVTATLGDPGPKKYRTLKDAFDKINDGTHRRDVTITLVGNTVETASAALISGAVPNFISLTIRPGGGVPRSIIGSIAGPLIDLNSADNVLIDGVTSGGLTISNASTAATASTIRLFNDATQNTIQNTTLKGSTTGLGVVYFGPGNSTGNSSNSISSNLITAAGNNLPLNGVYSVGLSSSVTNQGYLSSNYISDYFSASNPSNGINLAANNSGWVISNNRLFQTGTRTFTTGNTHTAINISSGSAYSLFGNTIGYANELGNGTYVMDGTAATRFVAINLAVGTDGDTYVGSNTVASISLATSSGASTGAGTLCGLNIVSGNVNIGGAGGNTFGATSAADSFLLNSTTSGAAVVGINSGTTGTVLIRGNSFGGFTSANASPAVGGAVFGINVSAAASSMTIMSNIIGSPIADNMRAGILGTTTADSFAVGINADPVVPATVNYSGNTIRNLSAYGTGTLGFVRGIQTGSTTNLTTVFALNGNTIANLKTTSALAGMTAGNAAAVGIQYWPGVNSTITGNNISNISALNNTQVATVAAGIIHANGANTIIEKNTVYGVNNASTMVSTISPGVSAGIITRTATTAVNIQNNMISLGSGQSSPAAMIGIWINEVSTQAMPLYRIYYNSVHVAGTSTGSQPSMGLYRGDFQISPKTPTVDIRNNIFNNVRTGGSGKHYAIANMYGAQAGATSVGWAAGASDSNALNASAATIGFWTTDRTFAAWKTASAGDGLSLSGITVNFVNSASDLHINTAIPSALESGGTSIPSLITDIDGQVRPGPSGSVNGGAFAPDLGADEFDGVFLDARPPAITYTPLSNVTSTSDRILTINVTDRTAVAAGANLPRIYYKKSGNPTYVSTACLLASGNAQNGTYSCPVNYGLLPSGSVTIGDSIEYFVVAQDTVGNIAASPSVGFVGTGVNSVTSPPNPPNSYLISLAYTGAIAVGTGGSFLTLTNPGGVFDALNKGVLTGNITINIVSDLLIESGTVSLNQMTEEGAGGYTVTIKPSGGNRTISGSSDLWILRIADADRVNIDGSFNGETANAVGGDPSLRHLTIQNTSITAVGGTVVAVSAIANNVQGFTIRNVNISGQDSTQTQLGIQIGGPSAGTDGGPNNNVRVENCSIQKTSIGIYDGGISDTSPSVGHVITMNDLSATGILRLGRAGMLIFNQDNIQVSRNTIGGIVDDRGSDTYGIGLGSQRYDTTTVIGGGITNALVTRNRINGIANINSSGFSAVGIGVAGGTTGTNIVSNNMISGVISGNRTPDVTAGIFVTGVSGSSTKLYFNSISLTGDRGSNLSQLGSYAVAITGTNPTVDLRDNILFNNQTSSGGTNAKSFAIGLVSTTFSNLTSNYNDFLTTGANASGFRTGGLSSSGTNIATLAGWRSSTGKDTNSLADDPQFLDQLNDLHLISTSQLLKAGTAVSGITIDIDGDTRSAVPDIGADEVDQIAPDTQILSGPSGTTGITSATFTFAGTDSLVMSVASFQCNLDGGVFNPCTSPITYTNLSQGSHTFQVRAIDAVGNVDQTPASRTWVIDTTEPDTQILSFPTNPSNSTSATFAFSGTDSLVSAIAGFECKLDTSAFAACTSPQTYNGLGGGQHTFQVRAVDAAGNVDLSPATYAWEIDAVAPDTQILSNPANPSQNATATFTFSGTDSLAQSLASFECKLDTADFAACTSPQNYSGLADGPHTFQVRAKDAAGNVDPTPATFAWTVDTTPPDTQILTHPTDPSSITAPQFTFSGTDASPGAIASFECKLDTAAFDVCTSPQNYSGLADGQHTFQVRAKDTAGNVDGTPDSFTWTISTTLSGTFTVGAGGDFTSLTNPGGLFDQLNTLGVSGNVIANITSDLTAETGAVALNQLSGGFGLTIKPSGSARTISGNGASLGMIRLLGADKVTIDGSLSGGTDRSLTLTYGNAVGSVVWIGSSGAANGATTNTVKNCVIAGNSGTTVLAGIAAGSGSVLGGQSDAANSNNTIQNNAIYRVQTSVYINGAAALDQNWVIAGNSLGSVNAADMNQLRGILIGNVQNFTVNGNSVVGVHSTASTTAAVSGIQLAGLINTGFVVNNTIRDVQNLSAAGTGAHGILISSTSAAANVTVANNFVSAVAATGSATLTSNGFGIAVDGAGAAGYRLYHNSVNLTTNQTSGISAAILVGNSVTTAGALDVRNNIFANGQTAGATRYAIYSSAAPSVYSALGYNDYFAQNVGFISGADRITLGDWQGASGMDGHSLAVDPRFVSATDLHLKGSSPMINAATLIASVTSDIDGQARPIGSANDIGADETVGSVNIDFDGDGKSDESVYRPSDNVWYLNRSQAGYVGYQFGTAGDLIAPADFTGDGKTDVAVFRPSAGAWFILRSEDSTFYSANFGANGDVPVPGDFDGDGRADTAVFRPSTGYWFIQQSTAGFLAVPFGSTGDVPTLGDFDGDGKTDIAVFRPTNGVWYRLNSSNGSFFGAQFGQTGDQVVPADYSGDGKTDLAIWRPSTGTWYIQRSEDNSFYGQQFGATGDLPAPADFDGDGKADVAVFRPAGGIWFEQRSTAGFAAVQFGASGDKPAPNAYVY